MFRVSHKPSVSARVEAYLSASRNFGKELSSRAHLWFIVSSHLWHFTRVLRRCRGHPAPAEPQSTGIFTAYPKEPQPLAPDGADEATPSQPSTRGHPLERHLSNRN